MSVCLLSVYTYSVCLVTLSATLPAPHGDPFSGALFWGRRATLFVNNSPEMSTDKESVCLSMISAQFDGTPSNGRGLLLNFIEDSHFQESWTRGPPMAFA